MEYPYNKKEKCTGCAVCKNICPKDAIKMIPDEEGFLYPKVEEKICINCRLCKKKCPANMKPNKNKKQEYIYAIKYKDEKQRQESQSGGAFYVIAKSILENNGTVYGAGYEKNFTVIHKKANDLKELEELRKSKYVQSDLKNTFHQAQQDLQSGKTVLYSGTPCQIAGLKIFLNKEYENLYTIDLVCHGVPSPLIWKENLDFIERKYKGKIKKANFRDKKTYGWHSNSEYYEINNKKINIRYYSKLFLKNIILRPSCYKCQYCTLERSSDITIGDCWGIEKIMPRYDDDKGISLVMTNTDKGKQLFNKVKLDTEYKKIKIRDEIIQPNLKKPSNISPKREQFWKEYKNKGYQYVVKKYGKQGIKGKWKYLVKKIKKKLHIS